MEMTMRRTVRAAIAHAPPEPLLPVEKKLIALSVAIGIVLLAMMAAMNHFIPAGL
jgi:hypothetical protein